MALAPSRRVQFREGEVLLKKSRANLQTSFIVPLGGRLLLTNQRLIFLPDRFAIPFPARRATDTVLELASVKSAEVLKGDMTNLLAGSFRRRLRVQCDETSRVFQVWGLDAWVESIKQAISGAM